MNHFSSFILSIIIKSNVFIVHTMDENNEKIQSKPIISLDDLNSLIREYPAFIQLTLQQHRYYTGSSVALCPLPYDENTDLDDPDVKELELFNPRKCEEPWTWTQCNQILVDVPVNGTVGKKLGNLIKKGNDLEILQSYTYYLNTMESAGITIVDRVCLFLIEVIGKKKVCDTNYLMLEESNGRLIQFLINLNVQIFREFFPSVLIAFKKYYISTLPLDCISNVLNIYFSEIKIIEKKFSQAECEMIKKHLLECRSLTNLKRNYVILDNYDEWQWDLDSTEKHDIDKLVSLLNDSILKTIQLFKSRAAK